MSLPPSPPPLCTSLSVVKAPSLPALCLPLSLQDEAGIPHAFHTRLDEENAWSPLRFPNANAFRDALAADMWAKYVAAGDFVEVVTPFQRAQRVANTNGNSSTTEVPPPTSSNDHPPTENMPASNTSVVDAGTSENPIML